MIHATAVVDKKAVIGKGVAIGPYAVIEAGVVLGSNVEVGPYVHIKGDTHVGDNTVICTGAVLGEMPQMVGLKKNIGKLRIGTNNIIREYVTIHTSTEADKCTTIGDNNFFMTCSHIAHDCHVHNNVVICNGTLVAGHVEIMDYAFISGNVVVHQFTRIGRIAMIGGLSRINQDVPPFMMVVGDSKVWGLNIVGLKRRNFSMKDVNDIKKAFTALYRSQHAHKIALEQLRESESALIKEIADFVQASTRGICGPKRSTFLETVFLDYPYLLLLKIPAYRLLTRLHRP
jgi:UDP-N-acetylglucosamine acyltransferase